MPTVTACLRRNNPFENLTKLVRTLGRTAFKFAPLRSARAFQPSSHFEQQDSASGLPTILKLLNAARPPRRAQFVRIFGVCTAFRSRDSWSFHTRGSRE